MWFVPSSALTEEQRQTMPTEVALRTPTSYLNVVKKLNKNFDIKSLSLHDLKLEKFQEKDVYELGELFRSHGSDKSSVHNYHIVYGAILSKLGDLPKILEIGLGSNNTEIPSNMGAHGTPGASIRAFSEFRPRSVIDGADIDCSIEIEGVAVFEIDQTKLESFNVLQEKGLDEYDLIIDDGLHSPDANLNTLNFALDKVSPSGAIVIEDIRPEAVPIWEALQYSFVNTPFHSYLIRTKASFVFVVTKNANLLEFTQ